MATPNVGILTNAGKNLIDQVNAGQTKITFSKIVFSSMDNSQLTDDQVKALTAITPQEVVVDSPEVTLDNNTGETRIRATGTNEALTDGVYVKTYAVYAKDDSGNESLYGITVSPNPNYLPEYDGVTPQVVTYSYKVNISNTSNITFTNSDDIYVSDTDLTEALQPYAKTVDVNQQLDKKVNIADMRKPASDVAGIEEVNAKQDKIGYTPADDSKVVHDNHDNTITANKLIYDLSKTGLTPIGALYSGSFNDLPLGTVFATNSVTDGPDKTHAFTTTTFYFNDWNPGRKAQIAIADITNLMYFRVYTGAGWKSWTLLSDDSKVAHLSGANNFDTVPTVDNNPLLLASSLPSDLARTGSDQEFTGKNTFDTAPIDKATGNPYITKDGVPSDVARTGQAQTFTAAQTFSIAPTITDASTDKGDNQAATMADLKSVEESAWHQLNKGEKLGGTLLYKIDQSSKRIYVSYSLIHFYNLSTGDTIADFSSIVKNIKTISGKMYCIYQENSGITMGGSSTYLSIDSPASIVLLNELYAPGESYFGFVDGTYFTYDSLVNN